MDSKVILPFIETLFEFSDVKEQEVFLNCFQYEQIKKGEWFLNENQKCEKLSFVVKGMLRIFVNVDGKEVTQWITTPGYFVTDLKSFISGTKARWQIEALTDVELFTISKKEYLNLSVAIKSWSQIEKLFLIKCFTILEDRIFSHLSMTAEQRYQYFFENHKILFQQVPLQYIASMLGMTAETLSRIRKNSSK